MGRLMHGSESRAMGNDIAVMIQVTILIYGQELSLVGDLTILDYG